MKIHGYRSGTREEQRPKTRAYVAWTNMRQRCTNPKLGDFKNYGKRGITFCRRWEDFSAFLEDMGEPPEGKMLERVDNEGDYEPGNCRWATREEQNLNKRNVKRYEFGGRYMTLGQWAKATGIKRLTLRWRLQHGMPFEVAISKGPWVRWNK